MEEPQRFVAGHGEDGNAGWFNNEFPLYKGKARKLEIR